MEIINNIKSKLGQLCNRPGTAFYSHISTLSKGDYLILGLNPGGNPDEIDSTIENSFVDFQVDGYNAYFAEDWTTNGRPHRLQQNLRYLFDRLGYDLRKVCASNLFFERTINERLIDTTFAGTYEEIHQMILDVVQPHTIVSFGIKPFNIINGLIGGETNEKFEKSAGHGTWKIRFAKGKIKDRKVKLIGLPHLSIYTLYNRPEQMNMLQEFVAGP